MRCRYSIGPILIERNVPPMSVSSISMCLMLLFMYYYNIIIHIIMQYNNNIIFFCTKNSKQILLQARFLKTLNG